MARWSRWLTTTKAMQLFQVLRQGGAVLTAILLAHSSLPTAAIGQYEMLLYLGALLGFAWLTGFLQSLLSLYPRLDEESQRRLKGQAWLLFVGISSLLALPLVLFPSWTLAVFTQRSDISFAPIFGLFLLANWPAHLQEHFYLLDGRARTIVVYGALSAGAQLLVVVVPPWCGLDFGWSFLGLAAVGLAKWIWLAWYVHQHGRLSPDTALLRRWWRSAWPLILYALLGIMVQSFGPWYVAYHYDGDERQFALYRYGAKELPLVMALAGAFSASLLPLLAANLAEGLSQLRRKIRPLLHLVFPPTILLLLTSRWWFTWVFSPDFAGSVPLFNTFLLTTMWQLWFVRTVLVGMQDNRWQPLFVVAAGGILVLSCVLLTPRLGLLGIALAAVLAAGVEKALLSMYLWWKYRIGPGRYTPLGWYFVYSLALLVAYFISLSHA